MARQRQVGRRELPSPVDDRVHAARQPHDRDGVIIHVRGATSFDPASDCEHGVPKVASVRPRISLSLRANLG